MKRTAIGAGAYVDETGGYWARPWIHRRRTWRRLKATTARKAQAEVNQVEWSAPAENFASLATLYTEACCPNKRLEPRAEGFTKEETARVKHLIGFFGRYPTDEIKLPLIPAYKAWRVKNIKRGTGERAVDKDLNTLSNVLNYGVAMGLIQANHVARGRPRYRRSTMVKHCRESAPASAEIIHQVGTHLLDSVETEINAWQMLFACFTGCRTSELLRLRLDAATPNDAGFVQFHDGRGFLFLGRRSKGGVNPWAQIGPEFEKMLESFHRWHAARFPKSPWYFPAVTSQKPINRFALGRALAAACTALALPHITPHGLRSFYVTKRRSDGVSDTVIAGEIGDQTVLLMQTTYGSRPPNWTGGNPLSWVPMDSNPCWLRWALAPANIHS
jgi:integrase